MIRVRDLIALSKRYKGQTVQWSEWKGMVTRLSGLPVRGYSVLHSQVAYVDQGHKTPVLYIHDFSCHLERDDKNNFQLIRQTPTTPKQIKLLHKDMKHASEYRFDVTEGCVYARVVS